MACGCWRHLLGHLSMPWMLVHLRTSSNESQGQRSKAKVKVYLGVPAARPAGSSTAAFSTARLARDAASSSGPSDFQAAHFQAASREASWEL